MVSVLHVVSYYPPDRIGGVGEVVANVHRTLVAAGQRSTVLTTGMSRGEPGIERIATSPTWFPLAAARYAEMARGTDIVHIHHGEGLALLVMMRLLRIRTPVLLTLHVGIAQLRESLRPYTVDGRTIGQRGLRDLAYRTIVMRAREWMDTGALAVADRVSFISRSAANDVLPPSERAAASVIYNGLPPADAIAAASVHPAEFLFVGANNVRKRAELLPYVLAAVRKRRPDARLRIVGIPRHESAELLHIARELGVLDAIIFEGPKRSDQLPPYYRAAQVLLVPSAYEGLPMVILEAFQNGLPCVATRVSGHPEVIDNGQSGILVSPDSPDEMAEAALQILDDPELGRRMGQRGRKTVAERFNTERQVREYVELYDEMRREVTIR